MLATSVLIVGLISFVSGASVQLDSKAIQAMVTEAVRNILSDGNAGENVNTVAILKEIDEIKNQNVRLEQRIDTLEQENRDKDTNICFLQIVLKELLETLSGQKNEETVSVDNFNAGLNETDCISVGNELLSKFQSGVKPVVRSKRAAAPYVAFSVFLTQTHSNLRPGEAIKFDQVYINEGAGYNPYTGAFTAPHSGTYLFTFHFDSRVHTFVRLNVDGRNVVDAVANPHTGTHDAENMSGNTVIMHVGIGQAVLIEVYDVSGGEAASSNKYRLSTFSGYLLHLE